MVLSIKRKDAAGCVKRSQIVNEKKRLYLLYTVAQYGVGSYSKGDREKLDSKSSLLIMGSFLSVSATHVRCANDD